VSFAAMKNIPWHLYGRLAVAQSQLVVRSPYMDNELVSLAYQAPPALRKTSELSLRLIADLNPALGAIRTDMGLGGSGSRILAYPRRLHRYALFKAEWYYNLGMPHWLSAFDPWPLKTFEPLFLGSHKIDHYRIWFRDQLAEYIRSVLSDPATATRPYLKPGACQRLIATRRKPGIYVHEVSMLITLELIQKLFLGSSRRPRRTSVGDQLARQTSFVQQS
jgi:asparagine synthase (glutamine-hydrolysing)